MQRSRNSPGERAGAKSPLQLCQKSEGEERGETRLGKTMARGTAEMNIFWGKEGEGSSQQNKRGVRAQNLTKGIPTLIKWGGGQKEFSPCSHFLRSEKKTNKIIQKYSAIH